MNKAVRLAFIVCLLACATVLVIVTVIASRPARANSPAARADYTFPTSVELVPMGAGQPDYISRREAYKALWAGIYRRDDQSWMAVAASEGAASYPAGTVVGSLSGGFITNTATGPFTVARSFSLQPIRVAVLYSPLQDEFNQNVVWEEGNFEQLLRVYLWCPVRLDRSCTYFDTISPTAIISGGLASYDVLILPATRVGWGDDLAASFGAEGLAQIRAFVAGGGFLYAQSDAAYLAEAASVVPAGTVNLESRVTKDDNVGTVILNLPDHPLTFSWLSNTMYVLNEPVLTATSGVSVIATFNDTTQPVSVALLVAPYGAGKVVLMNSHPSDDQDYYPQVLDALLWAGAQRAALRGTLSQQYNPLVLPDVVPAYESVPVAVTTTFRNLWNGALTNVIITETVSAEFTVSTTTILPVPADVVVDVPAGQTHIVWTLTETLPGDAFFRYIAWAEPAALAKGSALVSTARADYVDPFDYGNLKHVQRNDLYVSAKMAARLNGDRDIELDGIYPLPADGYFFDIAGTIENKEDTEASNVVVTDSVALISPIVDVDDQTNLARVITDVGDLSVVSDTIWAANSIFFYLTPAPIYPLPAINGITCTVGVTYGLASANAIYTYTGDFTTTPGLSNSITVPDIYSNVIRLVPGGVQLPALKLIYHLGTYPGYDYEDPAWRYGLFSQELFARQVSFASDPMSDTGILATGGGGSVYTNLGGHPIPYHEYLSSGVVSIPQPDEMSRITYDDIWNRPHSLELRTVFYDIVPFPPPEYHAVVNTTFDMHVDFSRQGGPKNDFVLEYPANKNLPADLHLYLKSHSNFDPAMPPLRKDETLIAQGMFKGLGFSLAPADGAWQNSWSSRHLQAVITDTDLVTVVETPAYDFMYFQQWLQSQAYEGIDITGTLSTYEGFHREGVFKTNDGARFVYHQKAVGPNRYEVFDSHVQAVFGLSSDAQVTKKVAPVRVATYGDEVYHLIKVEDPWDPREFGYDPFIQSYGFGDIAATVYVGGRHGPELLWPRVAPGGHTQIRLEINNNTGASLTNLVITPTAAAGITVTARRVSETEAIEPLFFDFPFLHTTVVSDAWKTVWYYDVDVSPDITPTGIVYTASFAVAASNLPSGFHVPDAKIGVEGPDGVRTVYGQAANVQLDDVLPPYVTVQDARLANASEEAQLESLLATGQIITAQNAFAGLRDSIGVMTQTVSGGTLVELALPITGTTDATQWPWLDQGARSGTMYVVLKSRAVVDWSGTALANLGPVLTYTDPFRQVYTATGNLQTLEAHGAYVVAAYTIKGITTTADAKTRDGIVEGVENVIAVDVAASNLGDYIAADTLVTVVVPSGVVVSRTWGAPANVGTGYVEFDLGDLAPGDVRPVGLLFDLASPTAMRVQSVAAAPWRLIERTDGRFANQFVTDWGETRSVIVAGQLAGPLDVGAARIYFCLPMVTRNYTPPATFPLYIGDAIPMRPVVRPGEVFYAPSVQVPATLPPTGHFYLSSRGDAVAEVIVDDELAIRLNGADVFTLRFSSSAHAPEPAVVEVPRITMEQLAGQTVTAEYRDVYGDVVRASTMWLIWTP